MVEGSRMDLTQDGMVEIEVSVELLEKIFRDYPIREHMDKEVTEFLDGVKNVVEFNEKFNLGRRF